MVMQDLSSLDNALAYRIVRAARLLRVSLMHTLEPFDLGPEQYFVLFRLHERDGRSQGELVDPVLGDRANISRLVAGLETRGLVARRPNPADGRVRLVHWTLDGKAVLDRVLKLVPAERQRLFGELTDEETSALQRALTLIERQTRAG